MFYAPRKKRVLRSLNIVSQVALVLGTFGQALLSFMPVVHAMTSISVSTLGLPNDWYPGAPIKASSSAVAALRISLTPSGAGQSLSTVTVGFSGSGFATTTLADIATATSSGVALYREDGTATGFDSSDQVVPLNGTPNWISGSTTIVLTPTTSTFTGLTAMTEKIFYVVIRTSATAANDVRIAPAVLANNVVTTDSIGPYMTFTGSDYRVDTTAPVISEVMGYAGSATVTIRFSEAVQKAGGGNIAQADTPLTYSDGGGTAQAISSIMHTAGSSMLTVTMDGNLDAQDVDATPATFAPGSNKIADMAGNVAATTGFSATGTLAITTASIPSATAGTTYPATSTLVTFAASGGNGSITFSAANASTTATLQTLGLSIASTGDMTGTVLNVSGSFSITVKATDATNVSTTKHFTVSVAPSGGGGIPGISSVTPAGAQRGDTNLLVRITGTNTNFSSTSTPSMLLPVGVSGVNGITISGASSTSVTTMQFYVTVSNTAATGARDVQVSRDAQTVTMPNGFAITEAAGAGLSQLFPTAAATNVVIPSSFTFTQSTNASTTSYRLTLKASSDPMAPAIWDYAFSKTPSASGHCDASQCNVPHGAGSERIITPASSLAPNTMYYWQVRSYATGTMQVSDSVIPLEITSSRSFTTVASVTDSAPPTIQHRPVFQARASTILNVFARVQDNIATTATSPVLSSTLTYCVGSSCTPSSTVSGSWVGARYFRYQIPAAGVGSVGTVVRYRISASDGTNTQINQDYSGSPYQFSSVAAGTETITGSVLDGSGTCSVGVRGATVFAEGTGLTATTNASCAFTLSSVPFGMYDLMAVKDGYSDPRYTGANAGGTGYTLHCSSGVIGGYGGDTTRPRVVYTGPMDGMTNVPPSDSNFHVFLRFSKAMSQTSVLTPYNLTVKEVTPSTGVTRDITTSSGSWAYYPTPPNIQGIPPDSNIAVWSFANASTTFGTGKTIAVTVASGVVDSSGNQIQGNQSDGSHAFSFSTGARFFSGTFGAGEVFGGGAFMPARVMGTNPPPGMMNVPMNASISISFSDPMADDGGGYVMASSVKLHTLTTSTGVATEVTSDAISTVTLDSTKKTATIALKNTYNGGRFATSTRYRLQVLGGIKSANGLTIAPPGSSTSTFIAWTSEFNFGSSADTSAPTMIGSSPDNGSTGVPVNIGTLSVAFSKDMSASTINSNSVSLAIGSTAVNGVVEYRPLEREVVFTPNTALNASTTYTLSISTAVQAANGTALAAAVTRSFTTGPNDPTAPRLDYMNADEFNVAITFTEPVRAAKSTDTMNWSTSVLNPNVHNIIKFGDMGFDPMTTGTTVSLSSANLTFDARNNTLLVSNLGLSSSAIGKELYWSFRATTTLDLSGNALSVSASSVRARVQNSQTTHGAVSPGAMRTDAFGGGGGGGMGGGGGGGFSSGMGFMPENFATGTFGYVPQVEVHPFSMLAGQTTTYGINVPISRQITGGGTIVLTFPTGFDVSGAKQDINSPRRTDINGPGSGAVTFKCLTNVAGGKSCAGIANDDDTGTAQGGLADDGVVVNTAARTVTVYISTSTNSGGNDMLGFDIAGIKNSTVPKDFNTSGYIVDIKTRYGSSILESLTSRPIYIQAGGSYTLSGTITATGNTQIGTMRVFLMSPMTGPQETTSGNFNGGTTTTYSFTSLSSGEYFFFTEPTFSIGGTEYTGKTSPERISVSTSTTYNFTIASATSSGTTVTYQVTGGANEAIDVFAGSPIGFKVKQVTLDGDANTVDTVTMRLADGTYYAGVGPQMPKGFMTGPPPTPSYVIPKPKDLRVSGEMCTIDGIGGPCTLSFTLSTASKQIRGLVKDGSGKIMTNAEVYAYSPNGGMGTHAQTDTSGAFTMSVIDGSYIVGAFVPGMPNSREYPVIVNSHATNYLLIDGASTAITATSAASTFVIKISKPDYTIEGKVTDGTNVIQGASVFAYKTSGPGHANANTDNTGAYRLYVTQGTWRVGVYIPGYGQMSEQTVAISDSNASNINFAPSQTATTFRSVSGRMYKDATGNGYDSGEEVVGGFIRLNCSSFFNEAQTGADGTYSSRVPDGSTCTVSGYAPNIGEFPPLTSFTVSADVANKDLVISTPNTITFLFSSVVTEAYVEAMTPNGQGGRVFVKNATSTTLSLPNGNYQIRVGTAGASLSNSSVSGTTGVATVYDQTAGILTVDGAESLTVTLPTLRAVSGTVNDGSAAISEAWVEIIEPASGIHFGTKSSATGTFSIRLADSVTPYYINAMKPGYFRDPTQITVNGSNTSSIVLTLSQATISISGRITVNSASGTSAFVRAERQGGGFSGTQADTDGNYTLYVTAGTWRVYAVAEGFADTALSSNPVIIATASVTGKDINITSTVTLNPPKIKPITPANGGTLEDSTQGVKLTVPPNAFGTSNSAGSLQSKETNNVRATPSATPVAGKAKEIKASDSNGNPITLLNDKITVEMSYTKAELATTESSGDSSINTKAEADTLEMAYWDETTSNWVPIQSSVTYKDSNGSSVTSTSVSSTLGNIATVTITALTDHFSLYAPVSKSSPDAPDAPSGFAAQGVSLTAITLTWTATSTVSGYDLYRSISETGTYSRIGNEPTVSSAATNSYTDSNLSSNSRYYYKISTVKNSAESEASTVVNAATLAPSGGSSPSVGTGSGGGVIAPTPTPTPITTTSTRTVVTPTSTTPVVSAPVTVITPAPVVVAPTPTIPRVIAPAAPTTETTKVKVPVVRPRMLVALESVVLNDVPSSVQPGAVLSYSYFYTNKSRKTQKITVTRELVGVNGKVVMSARGSATLKKGATFGRTVKEMLNAKRIPVGAYEIRITIMNATTRRLIAENAAAITVGTVQVVAPPMLVETAPIIGASDISVFGAPQSVLIGKTLTYRYAFLNETGKTQKFTLIRQLVNENGKAVFAARGTATVKAGRGYERRVSEKVSTKTEAGLYHTVIKVTDPRGKVVAEKSFEFEILD